jgi:hypothetical protein
VLLTLIFTAPFTNGTLVHHLLVGSVSAIAADPTAAMQSIHIPMK